MGTRGLVAAAAGAAALAAGAWLFTPAPAVKNGTTKAPPPLVAIGGDFFFQNGRRHVLRGFQWEGQLDRAFRDRRSAFANTIQQMGANSTSLTVYGGDVTTINILTVGEEQVSWWRAYLQELRIRGIVPIVYLSEWEHNGKLPLAQRLAIADAALALVAESGDGPEVPVLWCIAEEWDDSLGNARAVAERLRAGSGQPITMHSPWVGASYDRFRAAALALASEGLLDGVLLQGGVQEMAARAPEYAAHGLAVVLHEEAPAGDGTSPFDVVGMLELAALGEAYPVDGWSIYPGYSRSACTDLDCPQPEIYAGALKEAVALTQRRRIDALLGRGNYAHEAPGDRVLDASDLVTYR